jgi:hypothetical protein
MRQTSLFAPNHRRPTPERFQVGSEASVVLWLYLNLQQPLVLDGAALVVAPLLELRKRRRIGAEMGWLAASPQQHEADGSPASPSSPRGHPTLAHSTRDVLAEEPSSTRDCLTWRLPGRLTLQPGENSLTFRAASLPPPGAYVYERVVLQWGQLQLEQDQLTALDADLEDLLVKHRPPPRRFSLISRSPAKRAVSFSVTPRAPVATLSLVHCPVLPPDAQSGQYRVSAVINTRTDSLHEPALTLTQAPHALAFTGAASLAFYRPHGEPWATG